MATNKNRASRPKNKGSKGAKSSKAGPKKAVSAQSLNRDLSTLHKKTGLGASPKALAALPRKRKLSILKKYKAVISGQADTMPLKKKVADAYRKADLSGITILPNGTAIIDRQAGYDKHEIEKEIPILKGLLKRKRKMSNGSFEQIVLPHRIDGIRQLIAEAKKNPDWDLLKKDGEQFRFGFGDGSLRGTSWSHFKANSLDQIVRFLEHYDSIKKANSGNRSRKLLNAVVIVRVKRDDDAPINRRVEEQATKRKAKEKAYRDAQRKAQATARKFAKMRKERGG